MSHRKFILFLLIMSSLHTYADGVIEIDGKFYVDIDRIERFHTSRCGESTENLIDFPNSDRTIDDSDFEMIDIEALEHSYQRNGDTIGI